MAEAISTNETVANDDITMDDGETSNENQSSSPTKKWPKFPNGKTFNNGFGFQRFQ